MVIVDYLVPFEFINHDRRDVEGWLERIGAALESSHGLPEGYNLRRVVRIFYVDYKREVIQEYMAQLEKNKDGGPSVKLYRTRWEIDGTLYTCALTLHELKQHLRSNIVDPKFSHLKFNIFCKDLDASEYYEDEEIGAVFYAAVYRTLSKSQIIHQH
jgi:hypothetical protein